MSRPDEDPPEPTLMSWPAWGYAALAAVLIIAIGGLSTWLALKYDALRPQVGDMIVFLPAAPDGDAWELHVAAASVPGGTGVSPCVFDPKIIAAAGGSLVVEAREDTSPPRFQLHWAGGPTAKGSENCGAAADLTVDRYDLQRLANAAGGFGVRPTMVR